MTTSNTATRARVHFDTYRKTAEEQTRLAERLPGQRASIPHLLVAAEYWSRAWGVANLMSATCAAADFGAWDRRRKDALDGTQAANRAIMELVGGAELVA